MTLTKYVTNESRFWKVYVQAFWRSEFFLVPSSIEIWMAWMTRDLNVLWDTLSRIKCKHFILQNILFRDKSKNVFNFSHFFILRRITIIDQTIENLGELIVCSDFPFGVIWDVCQFSLWLIYEESRSFICGNLLSMPFISFLSSTSVCKHWDDDCKQAFFFSLQLYTDVNIA